MSESKTARWYAEDGYVGKGYHSFEITADCFDCCDSDTEIEKEIDALVRNDFEQLVSPVLEDREELMEWARGIVAKRKAAEGGDEQ